MTTKCRSCVVFHELYGGDTGGGLRCPKDSRNDRKHVYAMDDACDNYVEYYNGEGGA